MLKFIMLNTNNNFPTILVSQISYFSYFINFKNWLWLLKTLRLYSPHFLLKTRLLHTSSLLLLYFEVSLILVSLRSLIKKMNRAVSVYPATQFRVTVFRNEPQTIIKIVYKNDFYY